MKYLPLLLVGCVKTVYVDVDRFVEMNNLDDVAIGIGLQASCEDLRRRKEIDWEIYSAEIFEEREHLLFEVRKNFPWEAYPYELEECLQDLDY
jgi:hypothetical protein